MANLATFRRQLRDVTIHAPNAAIPPLLRSSRAQASSTPAPILPPAGSGARCLPASLQLVVQQTVSQLSRGGTVVMPGRHPDYGLRFHLRRGEQTGQVVVYYNKAGQRTRVVAQGPASMLSDEAVIRLQDPEYRHGDFTENVRLELLEASLRLDTLLERTGWTTAVEMAQASIINLLAISGEEVFELVFLMNQTDECVRCALTSASSPGAARYAQGILAELCALPTAPVQL